MKIELHECERCGGKIELPNMTVWDIPASISDWNNEGRKETVEICRLCLEVLRAAYHQKTITSQGTLKNEERLKKEKTEG